MKLSASAAAAILLVSSPVASGQTTTSWISTTPVNGDWFAAANWSDGVPTASDDATIENGFGALISDDSAQSANFRLSGNNSTLNIGSRGELSVQSMNIASGSTSRGDLDVTGGSMSVTEDLYVGTAGSGVLTITNNGSISSAAGFIGVNANSNGTARVSAGIWSMAGYLAVGSSGNGTLQISGTGQVSNDSSTVAAVTGSIGVAEVSGGSWTNGDNLEIGRMGDGTLEISGNGVVSNRNANVGVLTGSKGVARVSGGTWSSSGPLVIGAQGEGTLEISDAGSVSAERVTVAQTSTAVGNLTLAGGTLTTSQVAKGNGGGTVLLNGGTLRLSSDQPELFNGFSTGEVTFGAGGITIDTQQFTVFAPGIGLNGFGPLIKEGTGKLTIEGAMNYEGATTINAGTLIMNGTLLNSPTVTVESGATLGGNLLAAASGVFVRGGATASPNGFLVANSLSFEEGATLKIDLQGSVGNEYDQVVSFGTATLGGTLGVSLLGGFTPSFGDTFTFLSASGGIIGDFTSFDLPGLANGLSWSTINTGSAYSLAVVPEPSTAVLLVAVGAFAAWTRRRRRGADAGVLGLIPDGSSPR